MLRLITEAHQMDDSHQMRQEDREERDPNRRERIAKYQRRAEVGQPLFSNSE